MFEPHCELHRPRSQKELELIDHHDSLEFESHCERRWPRSHKGYGADRSSRQVWNLSLTTSDTGPGAMNAMEPIDHQGRLEFEPHGERRRHRSHEVVELIDHHGRFEFEPHCERHRPRSHKSYGVDRTPRQVRIRTSLQATPAPEP